MKPFQQQRTLFELPEREMPPPGDDLAGRPPRLMTPDRQQVTCLPHALDDLLPEDHEARVIWAYVTRLDVAALYVGLRSVEGHAGRDIADRRVYLALWLYATLRGVGSARELERLCQRHVDYQWICGGVPVNYHTLADFRTQHGDFLDRLLTESVATLMHEGLVELHRVAHDGLRVRASAGASSYRRRESLEKCLAEAQEQVRRLREELEADPAAGSKRQRAARERAARERRERIQKAVDKLPELEERRHGEENRAKTRVSTTDADATVMKMGDGGFRPAYNVQLSADTGTQIITAVEVVDTGGDYGQMPAAVEQHVERYQKAPEEVLIDGGFAKREDIEQVSPPQGGTTVYAPVQKSKKDDRDPHTPRPSDSPAVAEWRVRMGTAEAKAIYKERASTIECVNALARNRGLQQFRVRGRLKARAVALWYALIHNVMRAGTLRAAVAVGVA
jgi:transposase